MITNDTLTMKKEIKEVDLVLPILNSINFFVLKILYFSEFF